VRQAVSRLKASEKKGYRQYRAHNTIEAGKQGRAAFSRLPYH
jgi:hypothetical protein